MTFTYRQQAKPKPDTCNRPRLRTDTYEKGKKAAPGFDIYALEDDWLHWWHESGKPELKSPDAAFIGFCKKRYAKQTGL